ncbi:MAG: hypothetical protein KatS3mg004_1506 [Bryobacteraceae bacterium]|nr:MAG: hypothetical protein KatS3mg004_1506 [Bryobacteraceae bacterium]
MNGRPCPQRGTPGQLLDLLEPLRLAAELRVEFLDVEVPELELGLEPPQFALACRHHRAQTVQLFEHRLARRGARGRLIAIPHIG